MQITYFIQYKFMINIYDINLSLVDLLLILLVRRLLEFNK